MRLVPDPEDRAWLLAHLAELIRLRGAAVFMQAPLRAPTTEHFPDRWSADVAGVRRQLARVLRYASLDDLTVELDVVAPDHRSLDENPVRGAHATDAVAWFAGLDDDGTAHFGVDRAMLADPAALVGVLCHEVAHCYRARFELTYFDELEDELLTDLTTVYLGFGILTVNLTHAYRRRAGGLVQTKMGGYLSPVAMSFLLAAQVAARGAPADDAKTIAELLGGAQEACFLEAYRQLAADPAELGVLGVGAAKAARWRVGVNEGQPVFRVRRRWPWRPICSGPDCGEVLAKGAVVCANCGGEVRGDVATLADAAEAEERLLADVSRDLLAGLGKRNG